MSTSNVHPVLEFDPEWLAITRAFNEFFSTQYPQFPFPEEDEARKAVSDALQWVVENLQSTHGSSLFSFLFSTVEMYSHYLQIITRHKHFPSVM